MKFIICAIFICSTFINSEANVLPLVVSGPALPYSTAYAPGLVNYNSQPILVHQQSVTPTGVHLYNVPLIWPFSTNAEGTYIAKTLGSEYINSLPGHLNAASFINLEQAPGVKTNEIKDSSSVAIHGPVIRTALPLSISPFIVPSSAAYVVPAEAKYVAKNLGVEHIAPLPGHTISATSLNLQPAPGSK